jgi:hypothetical protein
VPSGYFSAGWCTFRIYIHLLEGVFWMGQDQVSIKIEPWAFWNFSLYLEPYVFLTNLHSSRISLLLERQDHASFNCLCFWETCRPATASSSSDYIVQVAGPENCCIYAWGAVAAILSGSEKSQQQSTPQGSKYTRFIVLGSESTEKTMFGVFWVMQLSA